MRKVLFAGALALASLGAAPAVAQQTGPFIGQVILVSFNFCPQGWHATDGALMPIAQNTALFSLIGTTYGGNGTTNFALPKLAPPLKGMTYCINMQASFPLKAAKAADSMMGPKSGGSMMGPKPHN